MNAKVPSLKKCEMSLDLLLLYFFKYVTVCKQKNVLVLQKIPENSICVQNQIMLLKVVQIGLKRGTSRISMYKVQQLNISSLMYKIHASIRVATLKVECTSGYSGGLCKWRFLHFGNWEIYPELTKYLECMYYRCHHMYSIDLGIYYAFIWVWQLSTCSNYLFQEISRFSVSDVTFIDTSYELHHTHSSEIIWFMIDEITQYY